MRSRSKKRGTSQAKGLAIWPIKLRKVMVAILPPWKTQRTSQVQKCFKSELTMSSVRRTCLCGQALGWVNGFSENVSDDGSSGCNRSNSWAKWCKLIQGVIELCAFSTCIWVGIIASWIIQAPPHDPTPKLSGPARPPRASARGGPKATAQAVLLAGMEAFMMAINLSSPNLQSVMVNRHLFGLRN